MIPCCALVTSPSAACSSFKMMFSTSSPTYPASVSVVASTMAKGTSSMREALIDRIRLLALFFLENLFADGHTFVADVGARVVRGRADQLLDLLLRFVAEGTAQWFVSAEFSQRCVAFRRSRPIKTHQGKFSLPCGLF